MKFQLDKVQGVYITKKHEMFEKNKKSDNAAIRFFDNLDGLYCKFFRFCFKGLYYYASFF